RPVPVERRGAADVYGVTATWSRDGSKLLVSASDDKDAQLYDGSTGRPLTSQPPLAGLGRLKWAPDGQHLAGIRERDNTLVIVDLETRKELAMSEPLPKMYQNIAWAPDGKRIVSWGGGAAQLWDAA